MNDTLKSQIISPTVAPPEVRARRQSSRRRLETSARSLEASGLYKILRKIETRPVRSPSSGPTNSFERIALVLDTETTGLDTADDEIIELAMIAVTYDDSGFKDVVGIFQGLREPERPLPAAVQAITGLTPDVLAGQEIDANDVDAFAAQADLIVAHNAEFDFEFCRRYFPGLAGIRWACSCRDIDWKRFGADSSRLASILATVGLFHDGHRALADCEALLEVFDAQRWADAETRPFAQLLRAVSAQRVEIVATGPTYDWRDRLKARGYRWSNGDRGRPKG